MYRNSLILPVAFQDFEELASAAQEATQGRFVGAYLDRGDIFGTAQLSACGGTWMDENGEPNFNNQSGLCWLEILRSFENAGPVAFDTEDDFERFSQRSIGVIIDGTWKLDELTNALGNYLVIDSWPAMGDGHLSGYVWAESVYMNSHISKIDQDAAWKFIEFLIGNESQSILSDFGQIPAVMDVQVDSPHIRQAMESLVQGTPYPLNPEIEIYWDPINAAMKSVFEGDVDPERAILVAFDQIMAENSTNR